MDTKLENSINHIATNVAVLPQFIFNNFIEVSEQFESPMDIAKLIYERCNLALKIHSRKYGRLPNESVFVKYAGRVKPMSPDAFAYEFRIFKTNNN